MRVRALLVSAAVDFQLKAVLDDDKIELGFRGRKEIALRTIHEPSLPDGSADSLRVDADHPQEEQGVLGTAKAST